MAQIHAGMAFNVIPDSCTLGGSVRTFDRATQVLIRLDEDCLVYGAAIHVDLIRRAKGLL